MRVVNLRLLGILMLIAGLTSAVAYGVHEYQVRRNAGALLREADRAKEREDWNEAIDFLDRYVVLVPGDSIGPRTELGMLQADLGRFHQAYHNLETVLRSDEAQTDVRRRLVDIAMGLRRYADAQHHLEILLQESPDRSDLVSLVGQCQIARREYRAGADSFAKAIERSPERCDDYARLAAVSYDHLDEAPRAIALLDEMVEKNASDPRAYVLRGTLRLERRPSARNTAAEPQATASVAHEDPPLTEASDVQAALDDARHALELAPDNAEVIGFAVRSCLANDRADEAAEHAQRGQRLYPKNTYMYSLLADVALRRGNPDDAIDWLKRGLDAVPRQQDLLWNLTNLLIDRNRIAEAEKPLQELRSTRYPPPLLRYLEALIHVQQRDWMAASQVLEEIRPGLTEWPDLLKQADVRLGQCYEGSGRADLQLTAFRRAKSVDPRSIAARQGLASALLSLGRFDEALEEFRQMAALPNAPPVVLMQLTRLLVLLNLRNDAAQRDWEPVHRLLARIEAAQPDSADVSILKAEVLTAQEEIASAEAVLMESRQRAPKDLDTWLALVTLAQRRDDWTKASELLEEAQKECGDSVRLRLAQAQQQVAHHGAEAKEALRGIIKSGEQLPPQERIDLEYGMADLTLAIGDLEESKELCRHVAEAQPYNFRVRRMLLDLALRTRNPADLEAVLSEIRRIERSGPLWHYGEAVRLMLSAQADRQSKSYAEAKDHLAEARVTRPSWSRIPVLVGQINDVQGDEEGAITSYVDAINLGERSAEVISRAVTLLYRRGRFAEADRLIRYLQEDANPISPELSRLAAEISLELKDSERALALITKIAASSKDPNEQIWAGRLLVALGRNDEAEGRFRFAIGLDESRAESWVALIQYLGRTAQTEKVDAALQEAERKITPAEAPLALAQSLESIGRRTAAEAKYRAAIDAAPDDPRVLRRVADFYIRDGKPQQADPLLKRLIGQKEGISEDDRIWSRRTLAVALVEEGGADALPRALSLIDENLAIQRNSDSDLRTKALILSQFPDRDSAIHAVKILDDLLRDGTAQGSDAIAEARFLLAQLHVRLGEGAIAFNQLRKLVSLNGDNPRYLAYYVQFLLSRNEISEAELWLDSLSKISANDSTVMLLKAEIQFARGRYEDVFNTVNTLLSNAKLEAAARAAIQRQAASLLESYGSRLEKGPQAQSSPDQSAQWKSRFLERAESLQREIAGEKPEPTLTLAAYLGRHGKHSESMDILERESAGANPEEIASVATTLLGSAAATNDDYARAEKVLRTALGKGTRPRAVVSALAHLENWVGHYDEAETLYRELLKQDSRNPIVLNNLAFLLALRGRGGAEPLELIDKALKSAGQNPSMLDSRAVINLMQGNPQDALADLTAALEKRSSASMYFHKALVELQLGKKDAARKSLAESAALGLQANELHPLERPVYQRVKAELR